MFFFFGKVQAQIPPPPPLGGRSLWSGTTLLDLDGDTVDDGVWAKQDIRDALKEVGLGIMELWQELNLAQLTHFQ